MNASRLTCLLLSWLPSWILSLVRVFIMLTLACVSVERAQAQTSETPTNEVASLADLLAHAPDSAGTAPVKDSIPFLITRVVPKTEEDDTCYVEAVTNGMSYDLFADGAAACRHLPDLHAIEWGRVGGRLIPNTLELVYSRSGGRVKTSTYFVRRSTRIAADWTEDR